jgi:hypothetical protein
MPRTARMSSCNVRRETSANRARTKSRCGSRTQVRYPLNLAGAALPVSRTRCDHFTTVDGASHIARQLPCSSRSKLSPRQRVASSRSRPKRPGLAPLNPLLHTSRTASRQAGSCLSFKQAWWTCFWSARRASPSVRRRRQRQSPGASDLQALREPWRASRAPPST